MDGLNNSRTSAVVVAPSRSLPPIFGLFESIQGISCIHALRLYKRVRYLQLCVHDQGVRVGLVLSKMTDLTEELRDRFFNGPIVKKVCLAYHHTLSV